MLDLLVLLVPLAHKVSRVLQAMLARQVQLDLQEQMAQ